MCVKDFFEVERVQSHVNKRKESFGPRVKGFYIGNPNPIWNLLNSRTYQFHFLMGAISKKATTALA